jgi:hypothetical protein
VAAESIFAIVLLPEPAGPSIAIELIRGIGKTFAKELSQN